MAARQKHRNRSENPQGRKPTTSYLSGTRWVTEETKGTDDGNGRGENTRGRGEAEQEKEKPPEQTQNWPQQAITDPRPRNGEVPAEAK